MSNTPVEGDDLQQARNPESEYSQHWQEMTNRLRKGGSLSGREQNCAFLNLDGSHFATISGLSGFDFPDDSRSIALSDWDGDGRMDVWISNRTAPRVRFLRNELASAGAWIQFDLQTPELLDPVGARIEIGLADGRKLLRTLRVGEGFLGQSSRFLHFGLGNQEINSLRVRWPDASWQEFSVPKPGQRYLLEKGSQTMRTLAPTLQTPLTEGPLEPAAKPTSPWIRIPFALPMPPIFVTNPDGTKSTLPIGKPALLNLWDPTCADCLVELQDWKTDRAQIPQDLQLFSLIASSGEPQANEGAINPFARGRIDPSSAELLAALLASLYKTTDQFAAPATFLINAKGELTSFAIGKVTVAQIASEAPELSNLDQTTTQRLTRAFGKQGLWLKPTEKIDLLFIPRALLEQGQLDPAADYVRRAYFHLSAHRDIDRLLVWIGDSYLKKGNAPEGIKFYLNALKNGTKDPVVMNNVAWQLATHPDPKVRNGPLAVQWAEKSVEVTGGKQATFFDTLAAAYAEVGRFKDALQTVRRGIDLATKSEADALLPGLLKARTLYAQGKPNRSQ